MVNSGNLTNAGQPSHAAADSHDQQGRSAKIDTRIFRGIRILANDPDLVSETGLVYHNGQNNGGNHGQDQCRDMDPGSGNQGQDGRFREIVGIWKPKFFLTLPGTDN